MGDHKGICSTHVSSSPQMKKSRSVDLGKLLRNYELQEYQSSGDCSRANQSESGSQMLFRHRSSYSRDNLHGLLHTSTVAEELATFHLGGTNNNTADNRRESFMMKITSDGRTWNIGRISVCLLLVFSLTDLLLNLVDAQMDSLVAPDHYDALSADVIRPAFRYHMSGNDRSSKKPRMGLGSAAISSVTETLSPILPFTGGLDLRREDYWKQGLFGSLSSIVQKVSEAFSDRSETPASTLAANIPRGGRVKSASNSKKKKGKFKSILSSPEPFIPLKDVAAMTLRDVSMTFRYALESTRRDFNRGKFVSRMSPDLKQVFERMSVAAAASRGKGAGVPVTGESLEAGDIDALHFCAAMRIFAEWRVIRQVPDGYKGYAVGMNLGQKDIIQNVGKVEQAVHQFIHHRSAEIASLADAGSSGLQLNSPTLRELLRFEIETGTQDIAKLPRLKEISAGMGLLWVRRQLQYQTALFANIIQVPKRFDSSRDAISAAYGEVYGRYHGWAVQKIFSYSFQSAPDASEVYKVMNPNRLDEVKETARKKILDYSSAGTTSNQDEDVDDNVFLKFGKHIGREWDKAVVSVVQIFGKPSKHKAERLDADIDANRVKMEDFIRSEMQRDAHEHIVDYLAIARPLLDDLAQLFDEFNMNDQTKV